MGGSSHHPKVVGGGDTSNVQVKGEALLDMKNASEHLACSERFLRRLVQERRIPFVRLAGTRIRFLRSDLDRWIDGQRIDALR